MLFRLWQHERECFLKPALNTQFTFETCPATDNPYVISCPLPGNGQLLTCLVQIWQPVQIWHDTAHRFGIVIMSLDGVFMRFDVNYNFFENDVVCTMLFLKTEGGKYLYL